TVDTLRFFDNAICVVFLVDFFGNVTAAHPKNAYLMGRRGWLDLLGSIPSFELFPAAGLLRLFRLSRLARVSRLLRGQARDALIKDVLENRGQYATFITILSAFMVLSVSTILMVQFESKSPDANITTGGDALWWGFTTITTVGYGDTFPVTVLGRVTAVFVMFAGVGIIGSLASILASVLVPPPKQDDDEPAPDDGQVAPTPATSMATARSSDAVAAELASIRAELAALRQILSANGAEESTRPSTTG
ncbi:MAG TPA: ion transporter, partial [Candidatus Saccharimonadia bacterium]|nr:ion transporter [Candidatus Saccharimonadia bacterium]